MEVEDTMMASTKKRRSLEELERLDRHLPWVVHARHENQIVGLKIRELLKHPKAREWNLTIVQALIGACFSQWRAAFLANKTGQREDVFDDAADFLDEMLAHNAIAYPQDRTWNDWTFNYYATNAARALRELAKKWPSLDPILSEPDKPKNGLTRAQVRWNRNHRALVEAAKCFEQHLGPDPSGSAGKHPQVAKKK